MKVILGSIFISTLAISSFAATNYVTEQLDKFTPVEMNPNIFIVNEQQNIMTQVGVTWVISYKDCNTISNSVIGVEVNGTNTLAIVQEGEEDQGTIMLESKDNINTFKALIPCLDTSITDVSINLKEGWKDGF